MRFYGGSAAVIISGQNLKDVLDLFDYGDKLDAIVFVYGGTEATGLSELQLKSFLQHVIDGTVNDDIHDYYDWFKYSDDVLYGDLRSNIKSLIMAHDQNGDMRVTATEFLESIGA